MKLNATLKQSDFEKFYRVTLIVANAGDNILHVLIMIIIDIACNTVEQKCVWNVDNKKNYQA